ncbi:hypothetical protein KGN15_009635 [Lactococcus lactis]|uniref:hypothetical protein n=1 Tax=Lactococcus lactis TaxID=1358 RepID=UPI001C1F96E9|nr:hypothetical protein [Lactococcus lactis]MBU7533016.1 hypothetical protein [Lactococcus lactis]
MSSSIFKHLTKKQLKQFYMEAEKYKNSKNSVPDDFIVLVRGEFKDFGNGIMKEEKVDIVIHELKEEIIGRYFNSRFS